MPLLLRQKLHYFFLFLSLCVCVCVCVKHGTSTQTAVPNHEGGGAPFLLALASVQEESVGVAVCHDIDEAY
jgi:hypothetical protein